MFRWPLALTPLSLGSHGTTRDATLEITPRGAVFILAALSHMGHPAHLAVIDAYVKGQLRVTASARIGEDSRLVASALAAPLVAAHELGIEQMSLSDLILLPPAATVERDGLTRTLESPRFLLRAPGSGERWLWVRAAERFEVAGCTGTPQPGLGTHWHDVVIQLPDRLPASAHSRLTPIDAELREPTASNVPSGALVAALRTVGQARFARAGVSLQAAADMAVREIEAAGDLIPLSPADLRLEARSISAADALPSASDPLALAALLADPISRRQPAATSFQFQEQPIGVSLTPDLDGYQTLCLLPPPDIAPAAVFEFMREAAWETIEALIGRPLAERRTEPISLRLLATHGASTTLDVGASVVVIRNQIVFTAWVGSDGRVMLKLFPAGGMPTP